MTDLAIEVDNLGKRYRIGAQRQGYNTLRDALSEAFANFRNSKAEIRNSDSFWALRDVSFEVKRGEVLGIIGRNGAGKSTLLKILSRVTRPTYGRARVNGRVGSLLEVGTGFHPELTGRENIFLNGAVLGMTKVEIKRRFHEIVEFAEIEQFLDTPVKRYSSGMYMRLAFSIAAHLEPEILVVDEVLAVGDAAFQKKSLGKMGAVAKEGRTVLLVSHNMAAIRSLCDRAILIEEGKIRLDGKAHHAITTYLLSGTADSSYDQGQVLWTEPNVEPPGCEEFCLRGIQLKGPSGRVQSVFEADKEIQVEIYYEVRRPLRDARFYLHVLTQEGENAFSATDGKFREEIESPGLYRSTCIIPGGLMNRRLYTIEMSCYIPSMNLFLLPRRPYLRFTVSGVGNQASYNTSDGVWPGVVCPQLEWKIEKISRTNEPPSRSVQS
jgi:lipopolysaccharide transport system ATP-binding protein